MWVIKMNKFGIVFGTLFTFFGGLLTSYKSNEITKITYEIQADMEDRSILSGGCPNVPLLLGRRRRRGRCAR